MSIWSNCLNKLRAIAAGAALLALWNVASPALAQDQQPQKLSDEQLKQLVAPIALYPDPLLAQILTASTYPLEVVMAARWSKENPNVKGQDLENAMQQQPWDPSVKGLAAVPQVLTMMNDKLDWTQQLGEAFLAQADDLTRAVQALRASAEANGNLKTTKEQRVKRVVSPPPGPGEVAVVPEYIAIEPVEPDVIYVPVYDPVVIYGVGYWPPAFVPFFWYPSWWVVGPVWGFWPALWVGPALWCQPVWAFGFVQVNVVAFSKFNHVNVVNAAAIQKWQHDPLHHAGVPYKNTQLQQKFGKLSQSGGPKGLKPTGPTGPKIAGPGAGPKGAKLGGPGTGPGGGKGAKTGGGPGTGPKGGKTTSLSSTGTGGHKTGGGGGGGSKGTKSFSSTSGGGTGKSSGGSKGVKTFSTGGGGGGGGSKGPKTFTGGGPKGPGGGGAPTTFRSAGGGGGGGGPKAGGGGGGPPPKHH